MKFAVDGGLFLYRTLRGDQRRMDHLVRMQRNEHIKNAECYDHLRD